MKKSDPTYIPMMENIRELLKDTIFADPAYIKEAVKATTPKKKK
jgi:hypothetical protein